MLLAVLCCATGCTKSVEYRFDNQPQERHFRGIATEVAYPDTKVAPNDAAISSMAPRTLRDPGSKEFWDMTLEEAVGIALSKSEAIRDLGGRIIAAPDTAPTIFDPALVETDPRVGVEAALSQFDTQFTTSIFWAKNDRAVNNDFLGAGTSTLQQDTAAYRAQFQKRAATGTQFSIRNNTDYDANNAPINRFPSAWNTNFEAEVRHPLLQGGGVEFNRIAGPNASPGSFFFSNGVLLARINTDISIADFEVGVRNLVSDVENAYWELYFAYRDLDAKIIARDLALETWRKVHARFESNSKGGEAEKEHQSREQYFVFQSLVENALSGVPNSTIASGGGQGGGSFRGAGGVYLSERRLRYLLGLPANDGRLIRPKDEPSVVKIVFDWDLLLNESLTRRVELRRQRWQIRRRELELIASRNFLLPRLDLVGLQRWRGFGDHLLRPERNDEQFNNAFQDLTSGQFQEWQMGFQFSMPVGFRQALAAVRNAQIRVARERSLLHDQELLVAHELSDSVGELDRAYVQTQTTFNRWVAAGQQLQAVQAAYDADRPGVTLDQVLDAQRRVADADSNYYRSLVEYNVAVKNVHFEKGSLLEYNGVFLAEGAWPAQAYEDAERLSRHFRPRHINYRFSRSALVSQGAYEQRAASGFESEVIHEDVPAGRQPEPAGNEPPPVPPGGTGAPPAGLPPAPATTSRQRGPVGQPVGQMVEPAPVPPLPNRVTMYEQVGYPPANRN